MYVKHVFPVNLLFSLVGPGAPPFDHKRASSNRLDHLPGHDCQPRPRYVRDQRITPLLGIPGCRRLRLLIVYHICSAASSPKFDDRLLHPVFTSYSGEVQGRGLDCQPSVWTLSLVVPSSPF